MAFQSWTHRQMSAIQSVGPQTSRGEIRDLYYQVYKFRRLPRSPPCGPEWMEELTANVVSSLKDPLRQKEGKPPGGLEEPGLADVQPSRSTPPGGGGGMRSPFESPSNHSHPRGEDREAELVCH